jgi:hypothetical protein
MTHLKITIALSLVPLLVLTGQLIMRLRKRAQLSNRVSDDAGSPQDLRLLRCYEQRVRMSVVGVLNVSALEIAIGIFLFCPPEHRWYTLIAWLPGLLILHHVSFLWLQSPAQTAYLEQTGPDAQAASGAERAQNSQTTQRARAARCRAISTIDSYFSGQALMGRYGFLAMLLVLFGLLAFSTVLGKSFVLGGWQKLILFTPAMRFGLAGAYAYVFLELGRRAIRNDITAGSIIWCLVTIVVGPGLAALVALVWDKGLGQAQDVPSAEIVLFFAGFAPRTVVAVLERVASQLLKVAKESAPTEDRRTPLTKVRGIGAEIVDRLIEEGVTDVHALANTEPVRLIRDTRFEMWQILSWVDEALLIASFPKLWPALQESGFGGASELVAFAVEWRTSEQAAKSNPQDPVPAARLERITSQLKFLTDLGQVPEALVRRVLDNLERDPRVTQVQALMSFMPTGAFIPEEHPAADPGHGLGHARNGIANGGNGAAAPGSTGA